MQNFVHAAIGLMLKFLSVFLLLIGQILYAQVDPSIDWKVLRYHRFDLIFDAKHQDLALEYGKHLQEIHQTLSPFFSDFPQKTLIIINDRTDLTNGYATPIPYSHMVLFPVLPGPGETISDHSDWSRELILHEYTHILSFEPNRDVVTALKYIYGNIIRPTLLLPRWWLEGIAVEQETRHTSYGRLRSPIQDALLRSHVLSGKLQTLQLAEINESTIHTWPGGARPYLWGSLMWSFMIHKRGTDVIEKLHWRYGGRVPFFIEAPVQDYFGTSYYGIFEDMKDDLQSRVTEQIKKLSSEPWTTTNNENLVPRSETQNPSLSPDGLKLAIIAKDETHKRKIQIIKRENLNEKFTSAGNIESINQDLSEQGMDLKPIPKIHEEDGPPGGVIARISWFPDSDKFIYDLVDDFNRFKEISDLHTYNLTTKKSTPLTRGLRAREPAVSSDGKKVVYVQLGAGKTGLGLFDIENQRSEIIYQPELFVTISTPVFWSEQEIIFAEKSRPGPSQIKIISLIDRKIKTLFPEHNNAKFPYKTKNGLIFTSTLNGVPNVFFSDKNLRLAKPITHLKTAAFQAAYDEYNDDLYLTEMTDNGLQINRLNLNDFYKKTTLPRVNPLFSDRYPEKTQAIPDNEIKEQPEITDYSVWPYILPHYWLPIILFDDKGTIITASTSGMDPLQKHLYSVSATYDSYIKTGSYAAAYNNNNQDAILSAKATDFNSYLINSDTKTRTQFYNLSSQWQFSGINTLFYGTLGWNWTVREVFADKSYHEGPSLGLSYSDFTMAGAQITPEKGKGIGFFWSHYLKNSQRSGFDQFHLTAVKYWSKYLPIRHAFMTKLSALYTAETVASTEFESSLSLPAAANHLLPSYLVRGYPTGQFFGKSILNTNLEYRFPIYYLYRGAGTTPLFIKRLHASLLTDGILLDGYSYNQNTKSYEKVDSWKSYWSTGAELKADVTLGFHIPLTFYLGYYWSLDPRYGGEYSSIFGIQL